VDNLAHPGGNVTGFTNFEPSMGAIEMLKEIAPKIANICVLMHPETSAHQAFWHEAAAAAGTLALSRVLQASTVPKRSS
jgi:putative ABC transport system substrate-binding protein